MEILENKLNTNPASMNDTTVKLNQLKADLDTINEHKLNGILMRSKGLHVENNENNHNILCKLGKKKLRNKYHK